MASEDPTTADPTRPTRIVEVEADRVPDWLDQWPETERYDPNWRRVRVVAIDPLVPAEYRGHTWETPGHGSYTRPPYRDDPQGSILQSFTDFQVHAFGRTLALHPDWFCDGVRDGERVHGRRWLGRAEMEQQLDLRRDDPEAAVNACFWCYPHLAPTRDIQPELPDGTRKKRRGSSKAQKQAGRDLLTYGDL